MSATTWESGTRLPATPPSEAISRQICQKCSRSPVVWMCGRRRKPLDVGGRDRDGQRGRENRRMRRDPDVPEDGRPEQVHEAGAACEPVEKSDRPGVKRARLVRGVEQDVHVERGGSPSVQRAVQRLLVAKIEAGAHRRRPPLEAGSPPPDAVATERTREKLGGKLPNRAPLRSRASLQLSQDRAVEVDGRPWHASDAISARIRCRDHRS